MACRHSSIRYRVLYDSPQLVEFSCAGCDLSTEIVFVKGKLDSLEDLLKLTTEAMEKL